MSTLNHYLLYIYISCSFNYYRVMNLSSTVIYHSFHYHFSALSLSACFLIAFEAILFAIACLIFSIPPSHVSFLYSFLPTHPLSYNHHGDRFAVVARQALLAVQQSATVGQWLPPETADHIPSTAGRVPVE